MTFRTPACIALAGALATSLYMVVAAAPQHDGSLTPLTIGTGRITIAGTSNIHEYTASTAVVRVTRVTFAPGVAGPGFWDAIVKPGALEAFEIAIPAGTLASPKEGLDKNMHKALKVSAHENITFRLTRIEPRPGTTGALRAIGVLQVAGVEREVTMDITAERKDATLVVRGGVALLMTDFGITPPKAMLGMLKTDPKVTITFDTILAIPLT